MTTSKILDLAADAIQEHGWTQGDEGWDCAGPLCLEGALMAAVGVDHFKFPQAKGFYIAPGLLNTSRLRDCYAYLAVQDYLEFGDDLWRWNDAEDRTELEVIAVLRAAAAVARLKEQPYDTEDQPLPLDERVAA